MRHIPRCNGAHRHRICKGRHRSCSRNLLAHKRVDSFVVVYLSAAIHFNVTLADVLLVLLQSCLHVVDLGQHDESFPAWSSLGAHEDNVYRNHTLQKKGAA